MAAATPEAVLAEVKNLRTDLDTVKKAASTPRGGGGERLFASPKDRRKEGCGRFKSFGHQLDCIRKAALGKASADDMSMLHEAPKVLEKWYEDAGWDSDTIRKATGMAEGSGPDGGFLLMPQYVENILEIQHDFADLLGRCDKYEMNTASMKFRAVDETSLATTRRGGVLGYWPDEGATLTASKPKFRQIDLTAHKVIVLTYLTDELIADSPTAEQSVMRYAADELMFQINNAIINGTGAGKPLGIINSACTISVAVESGQTISAPLLTQNIVKMYARLHASSRKNAVWLINQDILPYMYTMSLTIASAGVATFFPQGEGLIQKPSQQLLGLPIVEIPWCQTTGTVGDIILADMGQYLAATRGSVMAATSIHVQFVTDETAFRWTQRVGGSPWWNSALTPFNGTATQSPFVTLAVRT